MKALPSPSQQLSLMSKARGNSLNFSEKLENRQHMRKRMKFVWKARHVSIINNIPIDIVVEILARLPSKTLSRFKSVCKLWHSIIQSRDFILHHLHYKKSKASSDLNFITFFPYSVVGNISLSYFVKDGQDPHNFQIRDTKVDYEYHTSNSCNGLICVYGIKYTYVVNPSIEEYVELPKAPSGTRDNIMIALAYDARTDKCKVIRTYRKTRTSFGCMIFTLGSSTSWRFIEEVPYQICQVGVPVVVNDTVYFGVEHNRPEIGVSLSIKSETFDEVMHPNYTPGASSRIYEVGGDLCILDTIDPRFETLNWPPLKIMWTLKDYTWMKHVIDFKSMEELTKGVTFCLELVGIRDGKIMTSTCDGRLDFYDRALQRFEKPLKKNHEHALPYIESLISPVAIMNSTMERDV